ncbi:MAG: MBOAT family protein [Bacteroidetes bacterium]|nr:MBOAT family protein [Bacteroidota bacterium]
MFFNSIEFLIFLTVVFFLYWFVANRNLKTQNLLIVIASYVFYGWWDWRFLSLILFSTIVDYTIGRLLENEENILKRKIFLWVSVIINLGLLGFFKYYNFFLDSLFELIPSLKTGAGFNSLNIILPVGISFYTFQTMSYTIDIFKRDLAPTRDFIAFSAFVSFFPQLVAGPIERATNLLPQILKSRKFDFQTAVQGMRLMLWGFFKKIVIADALSPSVNEIFGHFSDYSSPTLIMGAVFFSFQIYCDFSGYSDIARGLAKLFGFELMVNFNFPYFSRNIAEFWRRWHISLSTWFRDYLYIPLGGSRVGKQKNIRNIFIIFLVSGLWHGANWTFVAWGGIHAILFITSFVRKSNRKYLDALSETKYWLPNLNESMLVVKTFLTVTIAWIFFRSESINQAFQYISGIFNFSTSTAIFLNPYDNQPLFKEFFYLITFIIVEYLIETKKINLFSSNTLSSIFVDMSLLIIIILNIPVSKSLSFIYFQF